MLKVWSSIQSSCIDNVHVISSIAKQNIDGKIRYEFFVPMSLTKEDHHLTIITSGAYKIITYVLQNISLDRLNFYKQL